MAFSTIVADDIESILDDLKNVLPKFASSTVLVTGGAGFLMSYMVDVLLEFNRVGSDAPCRVIVIDNFATGVPERLAHLDGDTNLQLISHDIAQPLSLDEPVHWIIHGASIASPPVYREYPLETIDANVTGTRQLLELARSQDVRGMLVMSTSEIYGDPVAEKIPTPEDYRGNVSCTGPRACYDESKRLAETLATTYHRLYGVPVKLIRPFNVYGPGLRLNDQRVLPDFMTQVLAGAPIVLLSDGTPTRAFCYISDATTLMLRILTADAGGEPFNVGNDESEISMADLAHATAQAGASVLGQALIDVKHQVPEEKDYLVDNPQRRIANLAKSRMWFPDWAPRVPLVHGLERTFQHHIEKSGRA